jgi:hypothetical protein
MLKFRVSKQTTGLAQKELISGLAANSGSGHSLALEHSRKKMR